jgi:hypothetical protein
VKNSFYVVENDGNGVNAELLSISDIFNRGQYNHTLSNETESHIIEPIFLFRSKEDALFYKRVCQNVSNQHEDFEGNERLKFKVKKVELSKKMKKLLELY